jgi:alkaline phosphatase D
MRIDSFKIALVILVSGFLSASAKFPDDFATPLEVIAFGSCNRDELRQPLWPVISKDHPDLWIWAGDNIYADWHERPDGQRVKFTINREWVTQRYAAQFNKAGYAAFREKTPIIGTWDDHDYDYGRNNAGAEYKLKEITRDLALSFMEVPIGDPRWQRGGLYGAYDFGTSAKMTKVILLDNRYSASGKKPTSPSYSARGSALGWKRRFVKAKPTYTSLSVAHKSSPKNIDGETGGLPRDACLVAKRNSRDTNPNCSVKWRSAHP